MNDINKAKWDKGKSTTLLHYTRKLPWKARRHNRELYLPDYFKPMIGDKKEVTIADLCAGMFCTIGSLWKTAKVKIYASDALADEFNQILKDGKVIPLIPIEKQDIENLSYPDNFFDIVHCRNGLDHTINPIKAIHEMYRVCKPGGYIYLRHFINVGEGEKYHGLHMWNIDMSGNRDSIIWNLDKRYSLLGLFLGFKSFKEKELEGKMEEMVVSILHKE